MPALALLLSILAATLSGHTYHAPEVQIIMNGHVVTCIIESGPHGVDLNDCYR